jgi:hypothetical protein
MVSLWDWYHQVFTNSKFTITRRKTMSRTANKLPQTLEEMKISQERRSESRLYSRETGEYHKQELADITGAARERIKKVTSSEKINLTTTSVHEVSRQVDKYLTACKETQTIPSVIGLASALGYSRRGLYWFLEHNPKSEVAEYLETVRDEFSSILDEAALKGAVSAIPAIFIAKSLYGRKEAIVLEPALTNQQTDDDYDADAIRQRYLTDSGVVPVEAE